MEIGCVTNMLANRTEDGEVNITFLQTNQQLLEDELGPRYKNLAEVIVLLLIYGLVFISGTVGNVCTCIVILRNNYMRTTTNYYLLSLAISDVLILLIGLPPEAYSIWEVYPWRFGKEFCIIKSLSTEMTSYASVLTITAFTIERYIAICRPLKSHKVVPTVRCVRIIVAIWLISFCCALPFPLHTELFYYVDDANGNPIPESLQCNVPPRYSNQMRHLFQMSTFVFFVFPLTVIIVLYTLIGLTLRKAELQRRTSEEYNRNKARQGPNGACEKGGVSVPRRCVLRVLVAVVVAFFVCWAPFHAQRLLTIYNENWTPELFHLQSTLFYISGVLYFIGSTVNPILYNVMSRRYRLAFMHTICRVRDGRHGSLCRKSSSKKVENKNAKTTYKLEGKTYSVLLRYSSFDRTRLVSAEKKHVARCLSYTNGTRRTDIVLVEDFCPEVNDNTIEEVPEIDETDDCQDPTTNTCGHCSTSAIVNTNTKRPHEHNRNAKNLANGIRQLTKGSADIFLNVVCEKGMIENDIGEFI